MLNESGKVQSLFRKGLLQSVDKLSPEYLLKHFQGQKDCGRATYPVCAAGRQASRWNDTMDVRMKQEILAPGMQDREESDLGAKMFGIGGHLHKRLRNGAEQQVVEFDGILTDQRVEQVGQRKYDVKVASRQQFVLPSSDPSLTGLSLALGTMAVTA